jgi:hypothetical protein
MEQIQFLVLSPLQAVAAAAGHTGQQQVKLVALVVVLDKILHQMLVLEHLDKDMLVAFLTLLTRPVMALAVAAVGQDQLVELDLL